MTSAGVDAAVLFPSVPLQAWSMHDDPFGLALMQTFNDWMLDDFCGPDPRRLIGLPLLLPYAAVALASMATAFYLGMQAERRLSTN